MDYAEARKSYFETTLYFGQKIRQKRTEKVLEEIEKIAPKSLLDVGCGPGFNTFEFSKKVPITVGCDISEEIYIANQYKEKIEAENIKFIRCSIQHLPFEERSFDVVNVSQVLEHISDVSDAIKEIKRVSKKHIFIDVPTILWEIYYYSFAMWWWFLTHPGHVISKLARKIKKGPAGPAIKEMWTGDHVNKLRTSEWIELLRKNDIEVKEYKKICCGSILFIHGIRSK